MRKVICIIVMSIIFSVSSFALPMKDNDVNKIQNSNLKQLLKSSPTAVDGVIDPNKGTLVNIKGKFKVETSDLSPTGVTKAFLNKYSTSFNMPQDLKNYTILPPETINNNYRVTVQQTYNGLPVFNAGVVLDINKNGEVIGACNNNQTTINSIPTIITEPKISEQNALKLFKQAAKINDAAKIPGTLGIWVDSTLSTKNNTPNLVWKFQTPTETGISQTFVDANDGSIKFISFTTTSSTTNSTITCTPTPRYHLNPISGTPDFITFGSQGLWIPESNTGDIKKIALGFFSKYPTTFGTGDVPNQLHIISVNKETTPPYTNHVVLQQYYGGYPVYGAQLRVHIAQNMTITSINGYYLRSPEVIPVALISENKAKLTAIKLINDIRNNTTNNNEPLTIETINGKKNLVIPNKDILKRLTNVTNKGIMIFPTVFTKNPNSKNDLVYQFQTTEANIFVSARQNDTVVFATPTYSSANRLIYDSNGNNDLVPSMLVFRNGQQVSAGTPNSEATNGVAILDHIIAYYAGLGWSSYDNHDSDVKENTNAALLMMSCPNARWSSIFNDMRFCPGIAVDDVVAHEFTHGVSQSTAGFLPLDEPGALNEHYSDVMAELIFPDASTSSGWVMGENTPFPRDLANPTVNNYANYVVRGPGCTGLIDVITNQACDFGRVHTNLGVGNRAAVFLSDGQSGTSHHGIGRDRLGFLFLKTLSTRMHPWSNYLDESLNTWETAMELENNGVTILQSASPSLRWNFNGAADEVTWAFTQVGVDTRLISGWYDVGGGVLGVRGDLTFYNGQTLPGGQTVADVELVVRAVTSGGTPYWEGRSSLSTGGGTVTFPGNLFGATITSSGIGTANKRTTVHYFHTGFLPLQISVNIIPSNPTVPLPTSVIRESNPMVHWSSVPGFGGKGDETVNNGNTLSGTGCVIDDVELVLLDNNYTEIGTTRLGDSPAKHTEGLFNLGYGAGITSANINSSDESVGVHWWFDVGYAVRYKLRYHLTGNNCSL